METSEVIAIIALAISLSILYFTNFNKGKLHFYLPFLKYYYKDDEGHFNISFPVSIWNSGSVSRSMNLLVGIVEKLEEEEEVNENEEINIEEIETDDKCFFFVMFKDLQGYKIEEAEKAPVISSISIGPRSSITKLISFKSKDKLFLEDGLYSFELTGHIDGSEILIRNLLDFEFEINEETHAGLRQDKYHKVIEFNIQQQIEMSIKEKKKLRTRVIVYFLLIFLLVILVIVAFSISSFGDIIVYNEAKLEGLFLLLLFISLFILPMFNFGKHTIKREKIMKNV